MNQISTTAAKLSPFSRLLMRVPVPWVFVLGYFAGIALQHTVFPGVHLSARITDVIVISGALLFMIGAITAGWGLLLFHKARTTTTPGQASRALVTLGPYRVTRNPMYVGLTIAYFGEMGLLVQIAPIIPLLLVIAYLNWVVIPVEERQLREIFGEDYAYYAERVGRWWL